MSAAQLTRSAAGKFTLVGALGFETVNALLPASRELFAPESQLDINLSEVTVSDSAGLALLIEWFSWATHENKPIRFIKAPRQLRALAKISDVDELLPFLHNDATH